MDSMVSSFCARCAVARGDCGGGIRLLQCAVAKGDRGDHVWLLRVLAQPGGMRFDGVEFLRADTHRGWGIASMARAVARWARFS
jgi:hypothetical protein